MWDILLIIFVVLLAVFGVFWVYRIHKRKQKAMKAGDHDALNIVDIITRNSGYCEQSTKNFTTVPFRVSVISGSSRSSSSKTNSLTQQTRKSTDSVSVGDKDERALAIRRKSDMSWKGNPLEEETKEDIQKYNEKAWT